MKFFLPPSLLAVALMLGVSLPANVFAENVTSEVPTTAPRTFVVTASRVEEDVLSSPAQTTVISSEDIAASGASTVVEALSKVASINFRSFSSEAQAEISMRGFGENSSGRVLVLVDGKRLNNPDMQTINWLSVPLSDVERIEVLQGSASVRYGNNAVGGVINIITKSAKKGQAGDASLSAGSFGENREQFSVKLGSDRAGLIASAEHYGTNGYRDRSGYRSASASLRGFYDLTDTLTLNAGTSLNDVSYQMPGALSEAQYEDDPTLASNYSDEAKELDYGVDLGLDWNPSETISLTLPANYTFKTIQSDMASWFTYTNREVQTIQTSPVISWNEAFGLQALRLVTGADLNYVFLTVDSYAEKERLLKTNAFDISQLSVGPYLTARFMILENLSVEGGLRYDRSTISAKNRDGTVDDSKTQEALVYDAGLVYRPLPDTKVYTRYGTLFRYPFTDEQASLYGFGSDTFLKDLEAEKGTNLEGGISYAFGKLVSVDASVYLLSMLDEIAYNMTTYRNENLDETRRLGSDLSLIIEPFPFMSIKASYSYVDAVFTDGVNKDKKVPLVAEHKANGELTFKAPHGISIVPNISYTGESYRGGDFSNSLEKIEAYTIYGFLIRFAPQSLKGNLELTAKVNNLMDEKYVPYIYDAWGVSSYYPGAGRSMSVGAQYRY